MALSWAITALLFSLALSHVEPSSGQALLNGSISCLDCFHKTKLSGIRVLVGCERAKKLVMAVTDDNGHFKTKLPWGSSKSSTKCLAKLLGGPKQLCSYKKNIVSHIVEAHDSNSYTIATPLAFFTSCSSNAKAKMNQSSPFDVRTRTISMNFGPSKTIDLPLPPALGLVPSSYYLPFFPIIGIP
ncbi:uncharacterized protein LOC122057633 [Macadamia integrifolia]|uniref:uncharacterized protein LOC122057633 n=1 Tax=Macadamia integrifolia TaxID=60698 RepID=UPI001C52D62C|nr:uncharacterized protein LOC122057633 [Macadamia integrifolia]